MTCNKRKSKEYANRSHTQGLLKKSAAHAPFCRAPHNHDKYCDQRNINIAVCHGLSANLNEPNHRNQCAQVPTPANWEVTSASCLYDNRCNHCNEQCGQRQLPPRITVRYWVKYRQILRPKHLHNVIRVGKKRIVDTSSQWNDRCRDQGAARSLGEDGDDGARSREYYQGNFFKKERGNALRLRVCVLAGSQPHPLKWPVIQQQ